MLGSWPPVFPNLTNDVHVVKSPYDRNYNCIAFAADDQSKWWWPLSPDDYWPPSVTNQVTMVSVDVDDLDRIVWAASVVKTIESALYSYKNDPCLSGLDTQQENGK